MCTFGSNLKEQMFVEGVKRKANLQIRINENSPRSSPGRARIESLTFGGSNDGEESVGTEGLGLTHISPSGGGVREVRSREKAVMRLRAHQRRKAEAIEAQRIALQPRPDSPPPSPRRRQPQPQSPIRTVRSPVAESPHPRFTNLPPSPLRAMSLEMAGRMTAWKPELPFPFGVDMAEYDPNGSQRMIQFEKQRSEAAHKKYLDTVAESKHAVDVRRHQREVELDAVKQRTLEREAEKLREEQHDVQFLMQEEGLREGRIRQAMEREVARVARVREQRMAVRQREQALDEEYEQQLEALRSRDTNIQLYVSRAVTRARLRTSLEETLHDTLNTSSSVSALLQEEAHSKHLLHETALTDQSRSARSKVNLHEAMNLGRTMKLAGVTRADVAINMGLIGPACPVPL